MSGAKDKEEKSEEDEEELKCKNECKESHCCQCDREFTVDTVELAVRRHEGESTGGNEAKDGFIAPCPRSNEDEENESHHFSCTRCCGEECCDDGENLCTKCGNNCGETKNAKTGACEDCEVADDVKVNKDKDEEPEEEKENEQDKNEEVDDSMENSEAMAMVREALQRKRGRKTNDVNDDEEENKVDKLKKTKNKK